MYNLKKLLLLLSKQYNLGEVYINISAQNQSK